MGGTTHTEPQGAPRIFGVGRGFEITSHHNANVLISFDGDDRASVRSSCYAWHETFEGGTPRIWGAYYYYYYDVVVRTLEGWRFAERQLRVAGNEDWDVEWHPIVDAPKLDV